MLGKINEELRSFDRNFTFRSFGVRIGLASDSGVLLGKAKNVVNAAFGNGAEIFETDEKPLSVFGLDSKDGRFLLFKDGGLISSSDSEANYFKYLNSLLRLEVAEYAPDHVFIHAGVVGWHERAIVIPGTSFTGKTTLTAELVSLGADYYSDEYAVMDRLGRVLPFPRYLSIRDPLGGQVSMVPVEELGGRQGTQPLSVGMVLLTRFETSANWKPEELSTGNGLMHLIPHTLTFRRDPAFSLKVLELIARNAIILKSPRGDVKQFAKFLLEFFENNTKLARMT